MAVAIEDHAQATTEIDLWGSLFTVVKVTKDTEPPMDKEIAAINKRAENLELGKHGNQVKVFAQKMDVLLTPAAGGKKKASTLIMAKWNANDLTIPQVDSFWESVQEEIGRPT